MAQFAFVGGSYQNAVLRADAQATINLYPETDRSGAGKSKAQLVGTPGLQAFVTLSPGPIRGIWIGENRMFAVSGANLYEVFQGGTSNNRGGVGNDGLPVQIFPNGNQIGIVSAGQFYCDNGAGPFAVHFPGTVDASGTATNGGASSNMLYWASGDEWDATMVGKPITVGSYTGTVAQVFNPHLLATSSVMTSAITTPTAFSISTVGTPVTASSGTFQDGYAIVAIPNSAQFNISALYDFSSWDPLDYGVKEGYPDHLSAVLSDHVNLYLLGKQTTEIWRNTGNPDFPFERIPGEVLQIGCVAPNSPDRIAGGIAFLGTDSRGGPVAFLLVGYQWTQISTPPIESIWAKYSTFSDAVSFSYVDGGHAFWHISFPSANATWVWDATESQWHQRAWSGTVNRTRGYLHGYVWGGHYVGDWQTGQIYKLSRDYYDDAGTPITRQRTAPHLANEAKQQFYNLFTLDTQPGEIANPPFTLSWSRDGGNTFPSSRTVSGGAVNDNLTRFNWRRLGAAGRGRVRTFRMTSTAPMRHVWIDAYINGSGGTN